MCVCVCSVSIFPNSVVSTAGNGFQCFCYVVLFHFQMWWMWTKLNGETQWCEAEHNAGREDNALCVARSKWGQTMYVVCVGGREVTAADTQSSSSSSSSGGRIHTHTHTRVRIRKSKRVVFLWHLQRCPSFRRESCEHRKEIVQVCTCTRNFKLENENYYRAHSSLWFGHSNTE